MNKKEIIINAINDYTCLNHNKCDKRKKAIKQFFLLGFNKENLINMRKKHINRLKYNYPIYNITHDIRCSFLKEIKNSIFSLESNSSRYNCTGIDWRYYHRPSSNGKGWVIIAPDEPANNWYIEDKLLLNLLTNKFLCKK
jgi:hypothetical protein